jgi:hypothetical protein
MDRPVRWVGPGLAISVRCVCVLRAIPQPRQHSFCNQEWSGEAVVTYFRSAHPPTEENTGEASRFVRHFKRHTIATPPWRHTRSRNSNCSPRTRPTPVKQTLSVHSQHHDFHPCGRLDASFCCPGQCQTQHNLPQLDSSSTYPIFTCRSQMWSFVGIHHVC